MTNFIGTPGEFQKERAITRRVSLVLRGAFCAGRTARAGHPPSTNEWRRRALPPGRVNLGRLLSS